LIFCKQTQSEIKRIVTQKIEAIYLKRFFKEIELMMAYNRFLHRIT